MSPNPDVDTLDWNINGTNEFEFVNTRVTSVLDKDGNTLESDALIGCSIIGNLGRPLAKLADGSSRDPEVFTIFGMKFGVKWTDEFPKEAESIAFQGDCSRSILTQFGWWRIPCYTDFNNGSQYSFQNSIREAPQYTTTLSNIEWGDLVPSEVLNQLHDIVGDNGKLSVRITLFYTTRNFWPYVAHNATLGYVMGSIGTHDYYDTTNVPGKRGMFPKDTPILPDFGKDDICSTYMQNKPPKAENITQLKWTNFAPFEIGRKNDMPEVRLDLSNSLPTDLSNAVRDFGPLKVGVLLENIPCVMILNEDPLPYTTSDEFFPWIFSVPFLPEYEDEVADHPLVLVQDLHTDVWRVRQDEGKDFICSLGKNHRVQIILQEYAYFVRPVGYYIGFLEKDLNPTSSQSVYVTRYGQPVPGMEIVARQFDPTGPPDEGVVPVSGTAVTEKDGIAEFTFKWNGGDTDATRIPKDRKYYDDPCLPSDHFKKHNGTLPIDGQIYNFYYCPSFEKVNCSNYTYIPTFFLAYSEAEYSNERALTWVDDVKVILSQYALVSPMMTKILNLANYTEVVLHKDIMTMVLSITDLDDPAYMPTTRDLSLAKRNMILKWLENPLFNSTGNKTGKLEEPTCVFPEETLPIMVSAPFVPPSTRCTGPLFFSESPDVGDPRLRRIAALSPSADQVSIYKPLQNCTAKSIPELMDKLEVAVQLEWATIPVYLTSLYSIVENCNFEIYELIQSVVVQEMLHMTQAANILIAMGGRPLIDDSDFTPKFPGPLPGSVLPGLVATLERLSIEHIHEVFMSIEVPVSRLDTEESELLTIGRFYEEIESCIELLDDEHFQVSKQQVKWPWKDLVFVDSRKSALDGIEMIISQGEGTGRLSPLDFERDSIAHFYKFEEIVCGCRLEKSPDNNTYSYSGPPIPFEDRGVWPMRPNPNSSTILYPSNCYTESRAFHKVYRMLLRKLQDMFDHGRSEDVNVAVQLMEALEGHGKKLMWTKFNPDGPDNYHMCGPVWEYDWPDDIHINPYPFN